MKTPGRRARCSRSPTRNNANLSAKIDADVAVKIYCEKLGTMTSRDGTTAALAAEHGITQKAVRDVWNLRTWAAATRPYWNAADREKWAQNHGTEGASLPQTARPKLSSSWDPGLQGPPMPAQAVEEPSACLTVGPVPHKARDGCEHGMAVPLASYLTATGTPSRPEGERTWMHSSETRHVKMAHVNGQPFMVAARHQMGWLRNPELGYSFAFERPANHGEQLERGKGSANDTARCSEGTSPPADLFDGAGRAPPASLLHMSVHDGALGSHPAYIHRPCMQLSRTEGHDAGVVGPKCATQVLQPLPSGGSSREATYEQAAPGCYPRASHHPSMCFLGGASFGDSQCSMASNATTVDLDGNRHFAWLQEDPTVEFVGVQSGAQSACTDTCDHVHDPELPEAPQGTAGGRSVGRYEELRWFLDHGMGY